MENIIRTNSAYNPNKNYNIWIDECGYPFSTCDKRSKPRDWVAVQVRDMG